MKVLVMNPTDCTSSLSDGKNNLLYIDRKVGRLENIQWKSKWQYADQGSGLLVYDSYKNWNVIYGSQ